MENDIDFDAIVKQSKELEREQRHEEAWADVFAQIADLKREFYGIEIDKQVADSLKAGEACFRRKRDARYDT